MRASPTSRRRSGRWSTPTPTSAARRPSGGFSYGGEATFYVFPGDTFGFRVTGRNLDSDNTVRGTLTLSSQPFVEAGIGADDDNRQWPGRHGHGRRVADGKLVEPGETRWFKFPVVPNQKVPGRPRPTCPPTTTSRCTATSSRPSTSWPTTPTRWRSCPRRSTAPSGAQSQVPTYPDVGAGRADGEADDRSRRRRSRRASTRPGSTRPGSTPRGSTRRGSTRRASTRPGSTRPARSTPTATRPPGSSRPSAPRRTRLCSRSRPTPAATPRPSRRAPATPRASSTSGCRATTTGCSPTDEPSGVARTSRAATAAAQLSSASDLGWKDGRHAAGSPPARRSRSSSPTAASCSLDEDEVAPYLDEARRTSPTPPTAWCSTSRSRPRRGAAGAGGRQVGCPYAVNLVAEAIADLVEDYRNDSTRVRRASPAATRSCRSSATPTSRAWGRRASSSRRCGPTAPSGVEPRHRPGAQPGRLRLAAPT